MPLIKSFLIFVFTIIAITLIYGEAQYNEGIPQVYSKPQQPVNDTTICAVLYAFATENSNANWGKYIPKLEKATNVECLSSAGTFGYFYMSDDLQASDIVEWHLKLGCENSPYPQNVMDSIHQRRDFYVKKRESYMIKVKK